jgi:hypothetical protein
VLGGYVVRDVNGQALVYIYSQDNEAEALRAKVLTADEARRIAFAQVFGLRSRTETLSYSPKLITSSVTTWSLTRWLGSCLFSGRLFHRFPTRRACNAGLAAFVLVPALFFFVFAEVCRFRFTAGGPETSITRTARRLWRSAGIRSRSICSNSAGDFGSSSPFGCLGMGDLRLSPSHNTP